MARGMFDSLAHGFGIVVLLLAIFALILARRYFWRLVVLGVGLLVLPSLVNSDVALGVIVGGLLTFGVATALGRKRLRGCGLLGSLIGGVLLVAAVLMWGPVDFGAAPHQDPIEECRDVAFVGLRGSGQKRNDHDGYGVPVGLLRDLVRAEAAKRKLSFADVPIDYTGQAVSSDSEWSLVKDLLFGGSPSRSQFMRSARVGADLAVAKIDLIQSQCGRRTRVVLVGYSQGALSAHVALAEMKPASRELVASTVFFADPLRVWRTPNPRGLPTARGRGVARILGAATTAELRDWDRPFPNVHSWCLNGDPVCGLRAVPVDQVFNAGIHTEGYQKGPMVPLAMIDIEQDLGW